MESWRDELYHSELYHHGIKGQKWGVKNGPPYPLKAGARSAAERKGGSPVAKKEKGLIEVGIILGIYSLPLLSLIPLTIANAVHTKKVKKFDKQCDKEREEAKVDKKTGLKLKSKELTREEDIARVNPKREIDPGDATYANNCVLCTTAYEMRRRGYEVQAGRALGLNGQDVAKQCFPKSKNTEVVTVPKECMKDNVKAYAWLRDAQKKIESGNKELKAKVRDTLYKEPEGSRGQLLVRWPSGGGHSVAYEIKDGKLEIIDAQINKVYKGKAAENYFNNIVSVSYQRYDNSNFDAKQLKKGDKIV